MVHYEYPAVYDEAPVIGWVMKDTPAAKAGLQIGDRITRIGDMQNPTWEQIEQEEDDEPRAAARGRHGTQRADAGKDRGPGGDGSR